MQEIKATMAGTILRIKVNQGDQVPIGQTVIVLESLKMEIPIETEVGGTIKELKVVEGDFVNEEDLLLILQSSV